MLHDVREHAPASPVGHSRLRAQERRHRVAVLLALTACALFVGWLTTDEGSAATRRGVSEVVFVLAPLVAAASCRKAHRKRGGRHAGWRWLAIGCLVWAAASTIYAYYDFVLGRPAPFPSPADLGYLGYAVPVAIGVMSFPRSHGNLWSRWRLALDGAVIAGCLLLASVVWVLGPVVDNTTMTFTRLDALAYPLADVVVAAVVLSRCMVLPQERLHTWVPMSIGWLVLALTDSIYVARAMTGSFRPGGLLDVGWLASFLLIAVAAHAPDRNVLRPARPGTVDPPSLLQQLLPYATFGLALGALLTESSEEEHHLWWLTIPLAAAVALRQFVIAAEHNVVARDLSDAVDRRTSELRHREQWWRDILQNLTDVVLVLSTQGEVLYCSPSLRAALGHWPELRTTAELRSQVHPDDDAMVLETISPVIAGDRRHGFVECRVRRSDDSWGWFEVTAVGQLSGAALQGAVLTLHDVSERRQLTDRLAHQAYHDMLTGLPNRALLMQRVEEALVRRPQRQFALLLIDLDDFKMINDRHGHASGDVVLEVIARRLTETVRAEDTVARLGGDEFALLVSGTPDQVRSIAERLADQIAQPVVTGGRQFLVRASIGAVFPTDDDSESPAALLSHADIALYQAKEQHDKGGIVLIAGEERDAAAQQVYLREQIAQPDLDQFFVVFQPIVDLASGGMRGVETLLRWDHPELGLIPPDVFIPMAEHGGSIQRLGWFVLSEACRQLAQWRRETPHHRLAMGVNVSIRQLDEPAFAAQVLAMIEEYGIEPDEIVLELTEESLAVDFEMAIAVVAELRAGGVSVAVDDYGTGYSSLQYLHRFAADVVKIDRSFIANIQGSVHTQKIVGAVMDMAVALDLQSIAEGIETPEQLSLIRELGCELGQGYLFSRPVPAREITALLRSGRPLAEPDVVRLPAVS
jgi:diguanylate cyclase (GGDEF)-like protein/PAS domain S-box-containing protein